MSVVADSRARAHAVGAEELRARLQPPVRMTVSEWADRYRILSPESSPEPGPWRTSRAPYLREIMDTLGDPLVRKVVWASASQVGKALDIDTPIATPAGWTTMGDVEVGDQVFDDLGNPCPVSYTSRVWQGRACFAVRFSDGSEIIADTEHKWDTVLPDPRRVRRQVVTTGEIRDTLKDGLRYRHTVPIAKPITTPRTRVLLIPPYTLGVWLGDGHSYSSTIYGHQDDMPEILESIHEEGVAAEASIDRGKVMKATLDPKGQGSTPVPQGTSETSRATRQLVLPRM